MFLAGSADIPGMGLTRIGAGAAVLLAGWTLLFGDPRTDGVGWKEVDSFESEASCRDERDARAREVRDKTSTNQPLEVVLRFYRCVPTR
jgi:hypothetical protein